MLQRGSKATTIHYKHIDLTMAFHYVHHASAWFYCNEFSFLSAIVAEVGVSSGELASESCQGQGANVQSLNACGVPQGVCLGPQLFQSHNSVDLTFIALYCWHCKENWI